jgi:predicted RNA binding protein YcfA (HicA-like mRNA interferase family)
MAIDYQQLRNLPARKIIRALKEDGFSFRRQEDSHQRYVHSDGRRVTVSVHKPSEYHPIKTLKSMIENKPAGPRMISGVAASHVASTTYGKSLIAGNNCLPVSISKEKTTA